MKFILFMAFIGLSTFGFSQQHHGDTVYYASGDIYIGKWFNGQAQGYGEMIWVSGSHYIGAVSYTHLRAHETG
jgi:hypothetical protein